MRTFLRQAGFVLLLTTLPLGVAWSQVVIANAGVKVERLSDDELISLFSMRATRWPDGQAVTLVVFPDQNPHHVRFVKRDLKIFPYQLRHIWDRYIFSGTGQAPHVVTNRAEMLYWVGHIDGAIGYLDQPPGPDQEDVHVVAIE